MIRYIEGNLKADGKKFGIVVSRFNSFISEKLLEGALDSLRRSGAADSDIAVVRVPGSFEIPLIAKKLALSGDYDAVICLGAVIRGATPHFDVVVNEVSKGAAQAGLESGGTGDVRGADHRNHRTGYRACRHQGRQQGR